MLRELMLMIVNNNIKQDKHSLKQKKREWMLILNDNKQVKRTKDKMVHENN